MTASERLAEQLRLGANTAAVVADPSNMFYLTGGYTGEGMVFLSRNRRVIVTDFRYTEQAENQAPGYEVQMTEKDRSAFLVIAELAQSEGITCIRTETNYLSVDRFEKLRAEKVRADRSKYSIGLLMMDIDHFKHVNDTYGHPIGDVVIKGIADTISKEIRGEIDVVARFGGEEFVVALIDTNAEGMVETAERIRKSVEKLVFDVHQAEPLRVTVSVGAFLLAAREMYKMAFINSVSKRYLEDSIF